MTSKRCKKKTKMDHNNNDEEEMDKGEEDSFHFFPDELVLRILSFVTLGDLSNRVSLVSMRFRRLSLDPALWKNLVIVFDPYVRGMPLHVDGGGFSFLPRGNKAALSLVDRCTQLRSLTVMNRDNAIDLVCRAMERNSVFGELKEIRVLMFEYHDVNADKLLETIGTTHGKAVRTLHLYGNVKLSLSQMLSRNPNCLQNLTSLLIRNVSSYGLSNNDYKAVADTCKNLRYFSCENSEANIDEGLDYLFHGLRESLEGFRTPVRSYGTIYTDQAFKNISLCGRLNWLSMRFDEGMSGKTLDAILEVPLLRTLILLISCSCGCSSGLLSTQDYVRAFGKTREKLEHLTLLDTVLKDRSLMMIADGCPNLVSLSLNGLLKVTDQSISRVLEKCGKLRDLELTWVENITSKSFEKVQAPLERLAFGDKYKYYDYGRVMDKPLSAVEEEKVKRMMPGLEICKKIRSYADENCWWESQEMDRH